jgi:ATP-binding cassette subfamily B multidrug efflux pump
MKSLSYLNKYFIKYKWRFFLGIIFIVISNYFGVQMPLYVKTTVDALLSDTPISSFNDALFVSLKIGGIYMLLSLGSGFFLFLTRQTIIIMSRLIEYDLKNEIYTQYQKLDYGFFKKHATGDLMNRISEDVSQVRMYLGPGVMYTINLIALFILVISQMVQISPLLTVFVLIPLPIMSFLIYKVSSKINLLSKDVQKEQSLLSTIAQETFAGIRIVKAYSREQETHEKFTVSAENYKKKNLRLVVVNALFMPTIIFLIGLSTLLSIYIGGKMTYTGSISLGAILAFIFFVNKLTWPFASIGWVTSINQRAAASQTRINEFLQVKPTIVSPTDKTFSFQGKIEFKNVTYQYPNSGITAIKNLSFCVYPGETIAFVGKTGSGKSTILHLLMRQYDSASGEIFLDDQPIKDINIHDFRNQTGIVPQEVFLFSDSIRNNVQFGSLNDQVSEDELVNSLKKAHVYHNIMAFPNQLDTLLGERGVNLSGGQKQRVSIARALIRKPKLLVLDDCLSAVDTETEEIILTNLNDITAQNTSILVSHRISSLRYANRIIVIEDGEKKEEGTHEELLAIKGLYADMYIQQLTEEKK